MKKTANEPLGPSRPQDAGRDPQAGPPLELAAVREKLRGLRGREYWRSLEEVANSPELEELVKREFPAGASEWMDPFTRRSFLRLMAASLAMAGVGGCLAQPAETLVPYVRPPEDAIAGRPLQFATAFPLSGYGLGILATSHEGRPTKLEGNPLHPASLGATDRLAQAAILGLYDPDRAQVVTHQTRIDTWSGFGAAAGAVLSAQRPLKGAGVRILSGTVTSPTLAWQRARFLAAYPEAVWHQYEPVSRDQSLAGSQLAFGGAYETLYHFDRARTVVVLDGDFLVQGPAGVRQSLDFSERRRAQAVGKETVRLYVLESSPGLAGAAADHRLPLPSAQVEPFARALARSLGVECDAKPLSTPEQTRWLEAIAQDLKAPENRGASIVFAGECQPPAVHALAYAMNAALGNVGSTVEYLPSAVAAPEPAGESIRRLAADLRAGKVELLLILGGNPVYDAPADLDFAAALESVKLRAHLSTHFDETSALCQWNLPEAHFLEAWGDVRAFDGTVTLQQPLIAPLYEGKSVHEVMAILMGEAGRPGLELVRQHWKERHPAPDFEAFWLQSVHDGVVAGTANRPVPVPAPRVPPAAEAAAPPGPVEVLFRPDPTVWDGRFANNGWLQELPKPLTTLVWENTVQMAPALAQRLGVTSGDVVEVAVGGRKLEGPVWVHPGHADQSVTLHLGYGRTAAGSVGTGLGFDAYRVRTTGTPWSAAGAVVTRTGRRHALARVQEHHGLEGRDLVRVLTVGHAVAASHPPEPEPASMYPPQKREGHAWGMAIDLAACIGCNGCVVACQAENNIPIVGKDQVMRGREMHWIRVDRYYKGGLDNPETVHQPVPCMQCENAPCEVVCPVAATAHSSEGLNDMVYNRCVGTRYCSNNCPYKVRRFNFLQYADYETPVRKLANNPDVTVRTRGVMEKCTYCVQRINRARVDAEREGRTLADGEVVTACQAACPARAIVFGDLNDPSSRVSRLKSQERNYSLLGELNTRPRTTYLASVRNPNPKLEKG